MSARRVVPALLITCVGLAIATAYLALELREARRDLAAARVMKSTAAPTAPDEPEMVKPGASVAMPEPASPDANESDDFASHANSPERFAHVRALVEDPDKRAAALRDHRRTYEKIMPGMARHLGMNPEEYGRLLDMLGEHQLRQAEAQYRCSLSPGCDVASAARVQGSANRAELIEFLGAENAQRFYDYQDNLRERSIVSALRGDLPDALRLSDAQAEQLAEALGDERRRVFREWEQRGAVGQSGMRNEYGAVYVPDTAQGVEQQVAEASEFQRRQRERAAQILTAAQLEVFTQRQKDALEGAQQIWDSQARAPPDDERQR